MIAKDNTTHKNATQDNVERRLAKQLVRIARRQRSLGLLARLSLVWFAGGLIGACVLLAAPGLAAPRQTAALLAAAAGLTAIGVAWQTIRRYSDLTGAARHVEASYPELDTRLLAAVAQRPESGGRWNYLQFTVIDEALAHARRDGWQRATPPSRNLALSVVHATALALFGTMLIGVSRHGLGAAAATGLLPQISTPGTTARYQATIEPGDVELERGTSLLALARFTGELPAEVTLVYQPAHGRPERLAMTKSLDDPLFAGRVADLQTDLEYHAEFGNERSPGYRVTVFDYPDLERADLKLAPPAYTGQGETLVEDALQATAVEGTQLTLLAHLNKQVAQAELTASGQPAIALTADPDHPRRYTATLPLLKTARYKLQLVDAAGRRNKQPAEFVFTVLANRRPEIKLVFPSRDVQVSPLEEIELQASVWDDFGLQTYGIAYSLDGEAPKELALGQKTGPKERLDVRHLLSFEQFAAQPDQLLSYYFFADDVGPDGQVRRTSSDMFFCEVRPFEEIYRQGEAPPGSQPGQEAAGNEVDKLAELQKQTISATWKVIRRETGPEPTAELAKDAPVLLAGQQEVLSLADKLEAKLSSAESLAHLNTARRHMRKALEHLQATVAGPAIPPLQPALAAEQAAYQALLKLRAREHLVIRGSANARGSSAGQRNSGQLSQLELKDSENRYEQRRTANPQEDEAQQETRDVLHRLRELAERQQDLNARIKELQSALEAAESREAQDEIRRQLKRLRDEQQQILRDADELLSRMDQPKNQERMSEARQQLDQTRSNVRQSSAALAAGQPQQAAAAGTRAQEQLEQLRDQFRKQAAGRFSDEMRAMRQEARELDKQEQQVGQQLAELDQPKAKSLRASSAREEVRERLEEQHTRLDKLVDTMRKTVEDAETAEPLLAKQLYDTIRQTHQQRPGDALDTSKQLLERGFLQESRRVEQQAQAGISRVKQGVERAAESVLGDEAEAIRRARDEVQQLASALGEEMRQATGEPAENADKPQPGQPQTGERGVSAPRSGEQQQPAENQPPGGQQGQPGKSNEAGQRSQQGQSGSAGNQPAGESSKNGNQPGQPNKDAPPQDARTEKASNPGPGKPAGEQGKPGDQPGQPASAPGQAGNQQGKADDQGQQGQGQQGQGQGQQGQGQNSQPGKPGEASSKASQDSTAQSARGSQRGGNSKGGGLRDLLGNVGSGPHGPLTGEDFRPWSDRLRDVEEMLDDPQLRAEAARIRDRAAAMRAEFKRHSQQPNWDLVRESIYKPLAELRARLNEELLKRESHDALVPLDRDPVPPGYSDQVRRYYERLGSGK